MSLLPLPKPRARSLPAALPDVGHSLGCPPQCLTATNGWSWCCSGRRPWPCWARVALLMGQEDPASWGCCACLLTRAPATSWVEAVPTRPTKYCLDPRRGHSRWGWLPWWGDEMRRTGSEVGSWAVRDKGTVPQGAQAARHPRRWSRTTPRSR